MNHSFAVDDYRAPDLRPIPWTEFRDQFLALYDPPMKSPNTRRHMVCTLDMLTRLGVTSTAELTTGLLAAVVKDYSPGRSPNSVRSRLRNIQAACTFAEKMGFTRISPFRIRRLSTWARPSKPKGKKHHSRAEISAVLALMKKQIGESEGWTQWRARRLYALTAFLSYTGCRAGEAYHMHVADLDLARGVASITQRGEYRLKTVDSEACVGIAPKLREILEQDWLPYRLDAPPEEPIDDSCPFLFPNTTRTGPWTGGSPGQKPRDRMKAVAAQAGVSGFTPLSCRHSLATHLKSAFGRGEGFVKLMLRHSNLTTQAFYTHDDADNLRQGASGIEF